MKGSKEFNLLTIQQYLDGKLNPKQMHELEKQALNDPFLADALEGYAHTKKPVDHELSILQRQLEDRIAQQQENKNYFQFTWQRLSIAAAAGLMFITVGILFWMSNKKAEIASVPGKVNVELSQGLAKSQTEPAPEKLTPKEEKIISSIKSAPLLSSNTAIKNPSESIPEQNPATMQIGAAVVAAPMPPAAARIPDSRIADNVLHGKVTDSKNVALPGVSIQVKGTGIQTRTNGRGEFTLPDTVSGTLSATFLGYKQQELAINSRSNLAIKLDEDLQSLNEVAVSAYGLAKESRSVASATSEVFAAQPVKGWEGYTKYLETSLNYPKEVNNVSGIVIVGFVIDSKGRPTDIRIVQSLNGPCDREAMRLIRQGPDWEIVNPGKPPEVRVTVNFRP